MIEGSSLSTILTSYIATGADAIFDHDLKSIKIDRQGLFADDTWYFGLLYDLGNADQTDRGGPYTVQAVYCPMENPVTLDALYSFEYGESSETVTIPINYDPDANG